jgi:2-amino-4-hydroxy-6-hydroxymethyldihydropteridine diphosphokinase
VRAFIGLGANLGDREETLRQALALLDARDGVRVTAVSSAYESAPWGPVQQPPYLNAAAELESTLPPHGLLTLLLETEAQLGRVRDVRWGPRTCDLDLLLYGNETIDTPDLQVPHPRLAERRFVLDPLLELAPGARLPDGRALAELVPAVAGQDVRRLPAVRLGEPGDLG